MQKKVSIKHPVKGKLPSLPFDMIKNKILGPDYDLSIVCVSAIVSRTLNKKFRGKDKPTNILSFPLTKKSGELVLHIPTIKHDAPAFELNYKNFLGFLLIHGMLHLKGMQHSSKMESKERQITKFFKFH